MYKTSRSLRCQLLLALGSSGLLGVAGSAYLSACATETDRAPSCDSGREPVRTCISREQMEATTRASCLGNIASRPASEPPSIPERLTMPNGCLPRQLACDGCCNPAIEEGEPQADGSCCYYHCEGSCCGRPFLVAGASRSAGLAQRADWLQPTAAETLSRSALSERIACEWREDALLEHASVATFARFTLELLAFAAPSELVEDAQRAGLDEVAHARACFSQALRYDSVAWGPGTLTVHDVRVASTLRAAAACTFVEGCIGETQAAWLAQRAASVASDPEARQVLWKIAEDEARHAELAWRFVAWAVRCDSSVAAEIASALAAAQVGSTVPGLECESDETLAILHAAGRLSAHERVAAAREALDEVVVPCWALLLTAAGGQVSVAVSDSVTV